MNKQMTPEEKQEARDYARAMIDLSEPSQFEKTYGEAMRWLCGVEGKTQILPPSMKKSGKFVDNKTRAERICEALKDGPLTRPEIAEILGVDTNTVRDYLRPALEYGRVVRMGWMGRTEKFGLAQ